MAEFQTVMREKKRMCKQIDFGECDKCPIGIHNNKTDLFCDAFMRESPEEAEKIVMEWSAKHPVMTNRRKFEEVFGFNIATMFEINCRNAEWLDEEYKEKT